MGVEAKVTEPMKKLAKLTVIVGGILIGAAIAPAIFPAYSTELPITELQPVVP